MFIREPIRLGEYGNCTLNILSNHTKSEHYSCGLANVTSKQIAFYIFNSI